VAASSFTGYSDVGLPDLIRRLTEDSRRLATSEVSLAKLEAKEGLHRASRGVLWMSLALGAGTVMSLSLTIFLITLIGRAANGHMWVGAIVTGFLELGVGGYLMKRGLARAQRPSHSLESSRQSLADTTRWASSMHRH
jgi:hypothetical protein